jgi:uncharacterized protein (DUF427 family)
MEESNTNARHYAVIDPLERKITLQRNGEVIASSTGVLILKEVGKSVYNPVLYFPKEDIQWELAKDESKNSHCPIKGDATYWIPAGKNAEGAPSDPYFAWSYEEPLPRAKKISGYVAFNENMVTVVSEPISN